VHFAMKIVDMEKNKVASFSARIKTLQFTILCLCHVVMVVRSSPD